ncbi:MAG: hypothetical protein JNJ45_04910 [Chthonomonas sp.]|nr:hypothetical protein [Chthonomonas sp.]
MKLAVVVALALSGVAAVAQTQMVYTSPAQGLSFTYPQKWKFSLKRTYSEFTFPVLNGASQAKLQILDAGFRGASDVWQTMQADVVKTQKRVLVKQWDEVYLGAPMLYTLSEHDDKGFTISTLSGLLYSRTTTKFQIRLEVPKPGYDEAETLVRAVLLTMRTSTGGDYLPEDPTQQLPTTKPSKEKPFVAEEVRVAPSAPPVQFTFKPDGAPTKPVTGEQAAPTLLAGSTANVLFAKGWTAKAGDEAVLLTHPQLTGTVKIALHSVVTSPTPARMLAEMMAADLKSFDSVANRADAPAKFNAAGYSVWRSSRTGKMKSVDTTAFLAVGAKDDRYWVLSYTGASESSKKSLALIEQLIRTLALEVKG